jgi:mRNA interferase MazF
LEQYYDRWNEVKKTLNAQEPPPLFHQGEVWWCSVGLNIGVESYGKGPYFRRPVLIMRKLSRKAFIGIPITTKPKQGTWFSPISIHEQPRVALLYQIRLFSANRLQHRFAALDTKDFRHIQQKLKRLLEL